MTNDEPWSFEDFEIDRDEVWQIYDPNAAQLVAVFYDPNKAQEYLDWVNIRQANFRADSKDKGQDQ